MKYIHGIETVVTTTSFSDKILCTVSQDGRLSHWVGLLAKSLFPLPLSHLTATTLLGGTVPSISTLGQLCATQIASYVLSKRPDESRLLVVGMGFSRQPVDGKGYQEIIQLIRTCLP